MYTGHNTAYVGGYTAAAGKAVLDGVDGATGGTGMGGARLADSTPSSGNNVYDTWEYLTIRNFTSSLNNSVMGNVNGGASDVGDSYEYDTIGPNEYGFTAAAQHRKPDRAAVAATLSTLGATPPSRITA